MPRRNSSCLVSVRLGEDVVAVLKPTDDGQGFHILLEGVFRSGNDLQGTIEELKAAWKTIDIDAE